MNPIDYCQQKAAPAGSTLHYSTLFLDPARRNAMLAVHALQLEIGALVRDCVDIEPARAKLNWWHTEIHALFDDKATHPVTQALAQARPQFPIAQEQLFDILHGYDMDLHQGRYGDFETLNSYCTHIFGSVAQIDAGILGCRNPQTPAIAAKLGIAQQLITIVRDLGHDARHGRLYLPQDELQRFGVNENDIFDAKHSGPLRDLLVFQAQRARSLYDEALGALPSEDRKSLRALLAQSAIQRALLAEIEGDDYQVLDRNLSLTPLRKLWIATRSWIAA